MFFLLMLKYDLHASNVSYQKCVEIQLASLDSKRCAFGDLSSEVADTLQLIGSVEMTKGRMDQAHRTMTEVIIVCHRTSTAYIISVLFTTFM